MELSPERAQACEAYRERIRQLMAQRVLDPNHIPNEPCEADGVIEGKN